MIRTIMSGILAAGLLPMAAASAQQTPADLDEAITEITRICMADQEQNFDSVEAAETSCACSIGMAGGYFNDEDFISYVVILQEILKYDDLSVQEQYDGFVGTLLNRGFDESRIFDLMTAAGELGEIEETFCSAYW